MLNQHFKVWGQQQKQIFFLLLKISNNSFKQITKWEYQMDNNNSRVILFWKITVILLGSTVLATCMIRIPGFWSSYVLDMAGPAMGYIILRVQYTSKESTFLSFKFTPELAALLIFGICFLIETSQFFRIYESHFDPFDYIAYVTLLFPCFLIDKWLVKGKVKRKGKS